MGDVVTGEVYRMTVLTACQAPGYFGFNFYHVFIYYTRYKKIIEGPFCDPQTHPPIFLQKS